MTKTQAIMMLAYNNVIVFQESVVIRGTAVKAEQLRKIEERKAALFFSNKSAGNRW